jgi:hypothetical protein
MAALTNWLAGAPNSTVSGPCDIEDAMPVNSDLASTNSAAIARPKL